MSCSDEAKYRITTNLELKERIETIKPSEVTKKTLEIIEMFQDKNQIIEGIYLNFMINFFKESAKDRYIADKALKLINDLFKEGYLEKVDSNIKSEI